MVFASLFNELCDLFSGCVREGEDVVNESFPDGRSKDYKKGQRI